ncbi:FtsX-like permease family protein [Desulfonatronum sp. SC1]|uniref:FtsX-like permease family protein n=1 Tax=Desulfonatronum sp. SC1 TaxID=2109626 RepID=UPI000D317D1C|nr:FtsX-like permease family protein [Desulfonatronum sp. SC1]PTN32755.1 ABC transporter permease [Desulfonatronum sp. SC1]
MTTDEPAKGRSPRSTRSVRPVLVIPGLAARHLRHDWVLTACLVIALAAVIAPLLVLLGLKHGTIATLRDRLVEDPVYREIRPAQTSEYDEAWFERVGQWPEIAFLTPTILPLSSVLHVVHPQSGNMHIYDLIPTAPGDPLLLENGAAIPEDGECVLTAEAARRLGLGLGDDLDVRVTRTRAGRGETGEARLRIAGVLEPRAGSLPRIYAPLSFVLDVEAFKEGYGAPRRGWSGDTPEPFLSYDGIVLLFPTALDPISRSGLVINTGFAHIDNLTSDGVLERVGIFPPPEWEAYVVSTPGGVVTPANIRALEQKLRGRDRVVLPFAQGVTLRNQAGQEIQPLGLSLTPAQARWLGLDNLPWGGFTPEAGRGQRLLQGLAAQGMVQDLEFEFSGVRPLSFTLQEVGSTLLGQLVIPVELLGVLRTAQYRAVLHDAEEQRFSMARGGYRGFRLYTRSIDDVPELYRRLQAEGIPTIAQVESIERIRVLDAGLSRLFLLIALLSVSGGAAVLLSSLYAAVERLRRDLGLLRLVGLSRRHVFFFPVVQGLLLAALGLLAGFGGYLALARAINQTFAGELAPGEKFCTLPETYVLTAIILTASLALTSSLVAAWRATRIDPAEVIRDN